jgi:hypothetical protein
MNTQYINASQLPLIWFEFSDIAVSYGGSTARKSSLLGDFAHLTHKLDDLHQSRATFVRATDRSIDMLTKALNALRKNKTHITDDHIERVIDDLVAARNTIK